MKSVLEISGYVNKLSKKDKELFSRIYSVYDDYGKLKVPKDMEQWVKKTFGSVKNVEKQKIVRVDNNLTFDTSIFNSVRAMRPMDATTDVNLKKTIKEKKGGAFCNPKKSTPEDLFGRIKGKHSISASNVAKFDALHGLVIFDEHNPLKFTMVQIKDRLETAQKWIKKANKKYPDRVYPYMLWNCLWRSAASIIHGHMQVLLGKNRHYGEIEMYRHIAEEYLNNYGTSYFDDLFTIHKSLGLGFEKDGCKIMSHVTPRKEKETIIISEDFSKIHKPVYKVLSAFKKMGVESFNLGIYLAPLDDSWEMPVIVRIIDRGELTNNSSDIGGTEIFGVINVVSSDPYTVINKVKKEF